MKSVRNRQIFILVAGVAVLLWACGGGGTNPTAPPSFESIEAEAKCATPPCGGGGGNNGGGGKNNADEVKWQVYASDAFTSTSSYERTLSPAESMAFDHFRFGGTPANEEFEQLALLEATHPGFAICFGQTGYTADDLVIERSNKSGEMHAVYRFGAMRLDGSKAITYEIVFPGLTMTGPWPPELGKTTQLSTNAFDVQGVAQKNNTCNGSGTLPNGTVTFYVTGNPPA